MTTATHPYDALMDITARPKAVFVRGAGSYLWDDGRKRYLDFVQGWAVNCLGHSPPAIADALAAQARRLLTPSPAFYNEPSLKLAQALVEKSCFDQVFFANSGAEANEGAIKLARKYGSLHKGGAFGRQQSCERHAAADALAERHDVGRDAGVLIVEELSGPAHAGLDLVENEQQAVRLGQRTQLLQELIGRGPHA